MVRIAPKLDVLAGERPGDPLCRGMQHVVRVRGHVSDDRERALRQGKDGNSVRLVASVLVPVTGLGSGLASDSTDSDHEEQGGAALSTTL